MKRGWKLCPKRNPNPPQFPAKPRFYPSRGVFLSKLLSHLPQDAFLLLALMPDMVKCELMPELAQNGHAKPKTLVTDAHRQVGQENRQSIRKTLSQALKLKDLAFQCALSMQGQFDDDAAADRARAQAQAVASLTKSWAEAVNVARVERGKPLPGSLRPEPKTKRKPAQSGWGAASDERP